MSIKCPNKNLQEWKDLSDIHGEDISYTMWNENKGGVPNSLYQKIDDIITLRNWKWLRVFIWKLDYGRKSIFAIIIKR